MSIPRWNVVLIGGIVAAAVAFPFGEISQGVVALLVGVSAIVGVIANVKKHQVQNPATWYGLASAVALFLFASLLSLVLPLDANGNLPYPSANDYIDLIAYAVIVFSAYMMFRQRTHTSDPTNLIDALIGVGGLGVVVWVYLMVPYIQNDELAISGRTLSATLSVLSLTFCVLIARLAFGPGAKNGAFALLTLTAFGALTADVTAAIQFSGRSYPGSTAITPFLATVGFTGLSAAARHPEMARLTEPSREHVQRLTRPRLAMLAGAAVTPPVLLLTLIGDSSPFVAGVVIGAWGLLSLLIMIRLAGLVRARERLADYDRLLSNASADLVAATDADQMSDAALDGMLAICDGRRDDVRATVLGFSEDDGWSVMGSRGPRSSHVTTEQLPTELLDRLDASDISIREADEAPDLASQRTQWSAVVPLVSLTHRRGAFVITASSEIDIEALDTIRDLARDMSLAIESAALTAEIHRQQSERRFRALVEHSSDVVAVIDDDGAFSFVSPAATQSLGYLTGDLVGTRLVDLVTAEGQNSLSSLFHRLVEAAPGVPHSDELSMRGADGGTKILEVTMTDLRHEGSVAGIVLNGHDITARKALEHDLRHQALHDDLTSLPNRVLLRDRSLQAIGRRGDGSTAMMIIDLDDFKTVNDGLGHEVGDEMLKVIAFRLQQFLRGSDTAARLGGDEFAILVEEAATREDVMSIARRVLEAVAEPLDLEGRELTTGCSIGVAFLDDIDDVDPEVMLRSADMAMYSAKSRGKNRIAVFDESMHVGAFERLELKSDLGNALMRDELVLFYQPIVNLATDEIAGYEALMRWEHPDRGMVSPGAFIPLAEETGLIVEMGRWLLYEAFGRLSEWQRDFPSTPPLSMSVNLSARQLEDDRIVDDIADAIRASEIEPSAVVIELTESILVDGSGPPRERLDRIRELGVGLVADDFGSGYASYASLQQMPFTGLKIDMSLTRGLGGDDSGKAEAQIRSIIELADAYDFTVVAEGVEEAEQRDILRSLHCHKSQGYFYAKPGPAPVVLEQLAEARLSETHAS